MAILVRHDGKESYGRTEGIGRPVDLSFTDAISGKPIAYGGSKAKIVVLDSGHVVRALRRRKCRR